MAIIYSDSFSKLITEQLVFVAPVAATVAIQGSVGKLTFVADLAGSAGNNITVAFTGGATAGAEVVTVVGSAVSVQIETGVSTAAQIKSAIDAKTEAAALLTTTATTSGAMEVVAATSLAGGSDGFTDSRLERNAAGTFTFTFDKPFQSISMPNLVVHSNHASSLSGVAKVEILNVDAQAYASSVKFVFVDYAGSAMDLSVASTLFMSMIVDQ